MLSIAFLRSRNKDVCVRVGGSVVGPRTAVIGGLGAKAIIERAGAAAGHFNTLLIIFCTICDPRLLLRGSLVNARLCF